MSKRPNTANGVMSRLRRPTSRLRDLPIWSKLGLIMLVPTAATIIVGVNGLVEHIDEASNAERSRTLSTLSQAAGDLVDHLQNERAYGVMVQTSLAKAGNTEENSKQRNAAKAVADQAIKLYSDEHVKVDQARVPYAQQKAALDELPANLNEDLGRLTRNLEDLAPFRSKVTQGLVGVDDVIGDYSTLIDDLLNVRESASQLSDDPVLADQMRAAAAVARAKDAIAMQRYIGH